MDKLKSAAAKGDVAAMTALAKQLIANPVSADSAREGQILLKNAIEAGSGEAAEFVGIMFASGMLGKQDWEGAIDYLTMAASLGWESAYQQLAVLVESKPEQVSPDNQDWKAIRASIDINSLLSLPERQVLCEEPRIRRFDQLIPNHFCDWMIEKARPLLARARTYDDVASEGKESDDRTNSAVSFGLLELDFVLLLIQSKMSQITGVPMFALEKPMVFHYAKGEEFRDHHDYLDPTKPAQLADMNKFGQRVATCLIYLNDDFEGAETSFPLIDKKFRCEKGGSLMFANVGLDGQPDPNTLHSGMAPTKGEKWLFSQWIRSAPNTTG